MQKIWHSGPNRKDILKGNDMADYKQPPRSLISNVMMYATQSGTDLFTKKKPTRVINKDENITLRK